MTIEVVTYDVGTGCMVVDHEWHPTEGTEDETRKEAREWAAFLIEQDKSTDHVTFVREKD